MPTLRPLVAGTDFSACSALALEMAIRLAGASGTRITLAHVCELGAENNDEKLLARCHETLRAIVAGYRQTNVEIATVVRSGKPWEKLDNLAVDLGASLIVIGRHGAGRSRRGLGSVATQLLRSGSRPVLTVNCEENCIERDADRINQPVEKDTIL